MATYFATCDLSMHRQYDGDSTVADRLVANSLEDLANPANRFAHYQYPIAAPPLGTTASCTMPLLVLDPIPQTTSVASPVALTVCAAGLYPDPNPALMPASLIGSTGNYLSSAYVLGGDRTGEDVIANNVLAFDIKGYDPAAPVIAARGADGVFGVGGSGVAGQDGSDDLILTPNDPGYAAAYATTAALAPTTVSYGEYVDLMWARKALNSLNAPPAWTHDFTDIYPRTPNLVSDLSGIDALPPNVAVPALVPLYTDGLQRSGKALAHFGSGTPYAILQPTYDTWTTAFDTNGTSQCRLELISGIGTGSGTVDHNAMVRRNGWPSADAAQAVDPGTDGLDTPDPVILASSGTSVTTAGVDDVRERETMPPFPVRLRGVKVTVRIEDTNTRQVKQMTVANEFSTQ
jgi:hypothetical protein